MNSLETVLTDRAKTICDKWFKRTLESYPAETGSFLGKEKNRFANPIAGSLSESLEKVIAGLASGADRQELAKALDSAIRVRAVQNFTASESVAFIFHLKEIVWQAAKKKQAEAPEFLLLLNQKIDELALIGFDKYMECREKLFKLQAYEVKNTTFKAFERAGLVVDPQAEPPTNNEKI